MNEHKEQIAFARPCFDSQEAAAAAAAVSSRWVVGGPQLAELERLFAAHCGVRHGIGVSSWTTGGFLALKALGIGPGDEVIVPSLTFIASVNVISHVGAVPVFADIDPSTYNIDPADIARVITPRTKAIMPVDQLGMPCEIDAILDLAREAKLLVIQDAACSFGSVFRGKPVGHAVSVAIFSLHARKVVTTGEGGMIVTNDQELATRLRQLRHQGMSLSDFERHNASPTTFERYPEIGYNFRITDIQASIGVVQMTKLEAMLERRRAIAKRYISAIGKIDNLIPPGVPAHVEPNWQSFQLRVRGGVAMRNEMLTRLHRLGIGTRRGVMASHLEAPYSHIGAHLPHTEAVAESSFQLPIYPDMTDEQVERVVDGLARSAAF